jgi:hypothetical protein
MSDKELKQLCSQWQSVLRLQDWTIDPKFVKSSEMSGHNRGECHCIITQKEAEIRLLPEGLSDKPVELVLIHELLHCHLNSLHVPSDRDDEEEQVINALSKTLYSFAITVRDQLKAKKSPRRK